MLATRVTGRKWKQEGGGGGEEVRDWALTGKEVVQASQDQADLVMAAPIM